MTKKYLPILFIVSLAYTSCKTISGREFNPQQFSTEQVFHDKSKITTPGACYAKVESGKWLKILCQKEVTKSLINQIQSDLQRIGFAIDQKEISDGKIGQSTKAAMTSFQKEQGMIACALDWATINRLKEAK